MMKLDFKGIALLCAVAVTPIGSAQAGETLDRVMSSGILTGAAAEGFPPVAFMSDQNELIGFDIDVAREIATRLGVEFRYVTPTWEAQTNGNWGGRWDIAVGSMTPTTARAEKLDFPGIYYYTPAAFAVHSDNSSVRSIADLNGKTIGTCNACSYQDYLEKELVIDAVGAIPFEFQVTPGEIVAYDDFGADIEALRLGDGVRVDAILNNLPTLVEAIEKQGLPLRIVGEPVFYEPLAVAVDKGDPEFTARIAEIIEAMHADGTLTRLSLQWFGVDLTKAAAAQ